MMSRLEGMKGPLMILLSSVFFSMTGTLQAFAPEQATPITVTFARMLLGAATLFCWCAFVGKLPRHFADIPKKPLAMVVISVLLYQVFFFTATKQVGVAVGSVVAIGATPIWAAILAFVLFRTAPAVVWYPATVMAIVGVFLINGSDFSVDNLLAVVPPLAAGLCYAVEIIYAKQLVKKLPPETAMLLEMALVSLLLLPVIAVSPVEWMFTGRGLLVSVGLGVFTAGIAFTCFNYGLRYTSETTASTLALSEPLLAACMGVFVLNEPVTWQSGVGIVLLIASVGILVFEKKPA